MQDRFIALLANFHAAKVFDVVLPAWKITLFIGNILVPTYLETDKQDMHVVIFSTNCRVIILDNILIYSDGNDASNDTF